MNLLYTITAYPPSTGGAQIHAHILAQMLQGNHNIQVVSQWDTNRTDWLLGTTLNAPSTNRNYTIDQIPVHRLGLSWQEKSRLVPYIPIYYPAMNVALVPIIACLEKHIEPYALQADLVHNVRIGREGLSYASLQIAHRRNIPFVFTPLHHPRWIGWRYKAYLALYQAADAVIALTDVEKVTLVKLGVPTNRIFVTGIGPVIANDADSQRFLMKHHIDGPLVLFLGQHYAYKGYRQVLEATQQVWQKVPETHFVFIGPAVGESEKIFVSFKDRRIHRLGKVDLQTKTDALAACTLLCVPSTQESFGGIYTEAWSFEKPVIGCNIPAVSEVITHDEDGYLVAQTADEIAESIIDLLLNPGKAKVMGAMGKQKVDMRYSWTTLAKLTEQVYHSLV